MIFKYAEEKERKEDKEKGRQREEEDKENENEKEGEEEVSSDRPSGSASSLFQKDQELVGRLVGTLSQKVQDPPYSHRGEDAEASIRPGATWSQSNEENEKENKEDDEEKRRIYDESYDFWMNIWDGKDEEDEDENKTRREIERDIEIELELEIEKNKERKK